MSELYKILLTSFLTVLGGVFVLALGQVVVRFVIDPLHDQKKVFGEVASSLILYANVSSRIESMYFRDLKLFEGVEEDKVVKLKAGRVEQHIKNEWERTDTARRHQRLLASQLLSTTNAIPCYSFWSRIFRRPTHEDINEASRLLIGISNDADIPPGKIAKLLKMEIVAKRLA